MTRSEDESQIMINHSSRAIRVTILCIHMLEYKCLTEYLARVSMMVARFIVSMRQCDSCTILFLGLL